MSGPHDTKQDELARKAHQAFVKEQRIHEGERGMAEEERRHADMLAKTKALRELRLARQAADADAAKAKLVEKPGPRKGGK